jgi:hypothetical protein
MLMPSPCAVASARAVLGGHVNVGEMREQQRAIVGDCGLRFGCGCCGRLDAYRNSERASECSDSRDGGEGAAVEGGHDARRLRGFFSDTSADAMLNFSSHDCAAP